VAPSPKSSDALERRGKGVVMEEVQRITTEKGCHKKKKGAKRRRGAERGTSQTWTLSKKTEVAKRETRLARAVFI